MSLWFPAAGRNTEARIRLFCFPYAGAGVAPFATWPRSLSWIEVVSCHLPGRETRWREPAYTRMSQLLDALEVEIAPWLDKPFAFFGHSMGALIAFFLARRLRSTNKAVPFRLVVSSCRAPHLPLRLPPLHSMTEPQFLDELERRYEKLPAVIMDDRELRSIYLNALSADFELFESVEYCVEPPLSCGIVALGGYDDAAVTTDEIRAWRLHTSGPFESHFIPGNHFYFRSATSEFLRLLQTCLSR
jgi:medium-chain acyl-[acyl-carrier-protein] hydrolase